MSASDSKPKVVFVLGGPGAGKGTQCQLLVERFGVVHLSAGDCLRAARDSGSADGELIENYIREGKIVPVEITVKLLKEAMEAAMATGKRFFLIDGFPRNLDNLEGWHCVMGDFAEVLFVLFFDCSEEVMEARLLKRGETSGRSDDNMESIRKRFHTYVDSTMPIIELFGKEGKVRRIDAARPVDAVSAEVSSIFSELCA